MKRTVLTGSLAFLLMHAAGPAAQAALNVPGVLKATTPGAGFDSLLRADGRGLRAGNFGFSNLQTRNVIDFNPSGPGGSPSSGTDWTTVAGASDATLGTNGALDPLFFSEIYGNAPVTLTYNHLDTAKIYLVQILHGEPRGAFMGTFANNDFVTSSGAILAVPSFTIGNNIANESPPAVEDRAIVQVELTGVTSFTYRMKQGTGRGPSIAGFQVRDITPVIVTTAANAGGGSLRQALDNAVNGAVIKFDPKVFDGEARDIIVLASELLINNKSVTIDATNIAGGVTVSGNNAVRCMGLSGTGS